MKTKERKKKKERSSLKFSAVFDPKLGAGQKQRSSPTICALNPSVQVKKGGVPCHNFAYYSTLIILSWRPKGGHGPMPPLNKPLVSASNNQITVYQDTLLNNELFCRWLLFSVQGQWTGGFCPGGCPDCLLSLCCYACKRSGAIPGGSRLNINSYASNPQYYFELKEPGMK